MKTATPDLVALLNGTGRLVPLIKFDFYTFTLSGGLRLYYGTADFTLTAADDTIWNPPAIDGSGGMWTDGIAWPPSLMTPPDDSGARGHWKTGLDSDSWRLVYAPRAFDPLTGAEWPDRIGSVPWLEAAQAGALDNADLIVSTAYFAAMPTGPKPLTGLSPVGTLIKFRGLTGVVDTDDTAAYITATDYRAILGQMMPRNIYQSPCRHTLYDARCTLSAAGFTQTGSVGAGSVGPTVNAASAVPAPGGSDTYVLGLMTMTSGANEGEQRMVIGWDGAALFQLLAPFPYDLAPGDTFTVAAGCDKTMATCDAFANKVNFLGEPYTPIPEVAVG